MAALCLLNIFFDHLYDFYQCSFFLNFIRGLKYSKKKYKSSDSWLLKVILRI